MFCLAITLGLINKIYNMYIIFCRENTTSSTLIESDEFLIPLHLKFTERDCKLGLTHGQCADDQYRSLDGSCNNMVYPTWGMAGQVLRRYLSPGYHDGNLLDCCLLSFHNMIDLGHSVNWMFTWSSGWLTKWLYFAILSRVRFKQ